MLKGMDYSLISSLKGRISKVLGLKSSLKLEEKAGLEGIFLAIDELILSKREKEDILTFNDELQLNLNSIKDTKKVYIKENIIPLVNKISTKKWRGNE